MHTGKTAVMQNIQGIVQFLQRFPPFDRMAVSHLTFLVEHCQLRFYAEGSAIIRPEEGVVPFFHIVKQGRVRGFRAQPDQEDQQATFEITVGECFPLAALLGERATRTTHVAAEDTFCLLLPRAVFFTLFARSAVMRNFALRGVSSLLDQVNQQVRLDAVRNLGEDYSLDMSLDELGVRPPVVCAADTRLADAVRQMHEQHVGSIVIVDAQKHPLGIFTLRDLRRIVADGGDLQCPIGQVMTPDPFCMEPRASVFDAAIAMTERHIAHLCLVADERLYGVLSERDLFSLQRIDLVRLARTIRHVVTVEALGGLRADISQLVERMLAHGASSTQIARILTVLNDHMVCRVIELTLDEYGDPGVAFSWLCFGSEGRHEQTLYTDQDNGILFEARDAAEAERIRQRLLPIAVEINQRLARCGFALCRGGVMAGNPELCLSRGEWSRRFAEFVGQATPENLLASTIYFDLRAVWGDRRDCEWLRHTLLEQIADNALFQRMMAENALRNRPPLGFLKDFVVTRSGVDKNTLDLKKQGLTPFVDAARLLALANGVTVCNTLERLQELVRRQVLEASDGAAYAEAYQFIQQLRMQQHQRQARRGEPYSNRLDPQTLNLLDRRILRESLRQAQRLQTSLTVRYRL